MRPHVRYVYPDHASWFYSLIAFITRALVPTRKTRMVQAYTGSVDRYDTMCAYFFEDCFGNRRVTIISETINSRDIHNCPLYRERIYPWVNGGTFKDIPSYDKLDEYMVFDALQGGTEGIKVYGKK